MGTIGPAWIGGTTRPCCGSSRNKTRPAAGRSCSSPAAPSRRPGTCGGLEQFLIDLRQQPEIAEAICRHVEEYYRLCVLRVLEVAGDRIDLIGTGGDIGTQRGMTLNPALWRRHIKPYSGHLIRTFKSLGYKTFYHSCGSIVPVIPDLIEVGLDLLDPIQPRAAGMNPEALFAAFGDRLSFHGGIDEQELLPHGTAEQVYAETTRVIEILGQNGGYVVAAAHNVQAAGAGARLRLDSPCPAHQGQARRRLRGRRPAERCSWSASIWSITSMAGSPGWPERCTWWSWPACFLAVACYTVPWR